MNFSGKIALVTGGSRGSLRAIAISLADAGADVAVMLARNGYLTGQSINIKGGHYPTS